MTLFKIRDKKTGLYFTGGDKHLCYTMSFWSKDGTYYTTMKEAKSNTNYYLRSEWTSVSLPIKQIRLKNDYELEIVEFTLRKKRVHEV